MQKCPKTLCKGMGSSTGLMVRIMREDGFKAELVVMGRPGMQMAISIKVNSKMASPTDTAYTKECQTKANTKVSS